MRKIRPLTAALAIAATVALALPGTGAAASAKPEPMPPGAGDKSVAPVAPVLITDDAGRPVVPGDPAFDGKAKEIAAKLDKALAAVPSSPTRNRRSIPDPAPAATPAPTAVPPDGTAEGAPDPAHYLIPASAKRFAKGTSFAIGRPVPGGTPAGATPAGLEEFYNQKIAWQACDTPGANFDPAGGSAYNGFQCAYLIVPVDYSNPAGPTAAIGLLKNPASSGKSKGAIFMDPGGPGSSGMNLATWLHLSSPELSKDFDFVGFDPRGVGSSLPMIRCKSSATFDNQRGGSDLLTAAQQDRVLESNTNACYQNTGAAFGIDGKHFIANVGTRNVVRDLDMMRAVLGEKKINYLGFSYGTSIGYQYAKAFGDNIRALVNDGVVNPFENNPDAGKPYDKYLGGGGSADPHSQIKGFQATFEEFAKQCAANNGFSKEDECALGTSTDVPTLIANYQKISQKAWGGTFYETALTPVRAVSYNDLSTGTIMALYSNRLWPYLNRALLELRDTQKGDTIMFLADNYYSRGRDGKYNFSDSAFQTIWCTDTGTSPGANDNPEASIAGTKERYRVAPFTDPGKNPDGSQRGLEPAKDWCTFYQTQHDLPKGETLLAMPNILVISTTYDSATPYPNGVVGAAAIGGTLLTVAGTSHTSYGTSTCATQIADVYFRTLKVPTTITGATDVSTKDIYSNVIKGNECQVTSFRPTTEVADVTVDAGQTANVAVTGLVRNQTYAVGVDFSAAVAPVAPGRRSAAIAPTAAPVTLSGTANEAGVMTVAVAVPADTKAGNYAVTVVPADLTLNDPAVNGSGLLIVRAAAAPTPPTSDPVPPTSDPVPPTSSVVAAPAPQTPPAAAPTKPPALSATGVNVTGITTLAALMLLVGAGLTVAMRRRLS